MSVALQAADVLAQSETTLKGLGAVGYGVIKAEALLARRIVGRPFDTSPDDEGTYGAGPGEPVELLVLGDSSAAGMGAVQPHETVGGIIANGVSALMGRRVHLTNAAVVGAEREPLLRPRDGVGLGAHLVDEQPGGGVVRGDPR